MKPFGLRVPAIPAVSIVTAVLMPGMVLAVLLAMGSCRGAFDPQSEPAVKVVDLDQALPARALPASVSLDTSLFTYDIDAEGPLDNNFFTTGLGAPDFPWTQSTPVIPGIWNLTVRVRDAGGTIIGTGTFSQTLVIAAEDDGPVDFDMSLDPVPGDGTLSFSLSWDPADLPSGHAGLELFIDPRPTGESLDLGAGGPPEEYGPAVFNPEDGTATWEGLVPAGSYLLRTRLLSAGQAVWGHAESVLVLADAVDADGLETVVYITLPAGTVNSPPVACPSLAGGAFIAGTTMKLTGFPAGTVVHYTVDGSDPSESDTRKPYTAGDDIDLSASAQAAEDPTDFILRIHVENRWGSRSDDAWIHESWEYFESSGIYVHAADGEDSYPGTRDKPKKTLGAAMNRAGGMELDTETPVPIYVAGGDYDELQGLRVTRGVTIEGGFDPDDWETRDVVAFPTTITRSTGLTGSADEPAWTIYAGPELTGPLILDGLAIEGPDGAAQHSAAVVVKSSPEVTIRNCYLDAGTGSGNLYGLFVSGLTTPGLVIEDCTITGRETGGRSHGLALVDVSHARIRRNRIYGGDSSLRAGNKGVYLLASTVDPEGVFMVSNAIMASGTAYEHTALHIMNNHSTGSKGPMIYNNTIFAGGATNRGVVNSSTVYGTRSASILWNNIILSVSGWAMSESEGADSGNADPWELRNNVIFGGLVQYLDSRNLLINDQAGVNDASLVLQSGGTSADNTILDVSSAFAGGSLPASEEDFRSFDWHLAETADDILKTGGFDYSGNPDLEAEDHKDLYGTVRYDPEDPDNPGPYSIGAAQF
jgi:hypothetical protein